MHMIRTHCVKLQKLIIKNKLVKGVVGKFFGISLDCRNVHESFDCPQSLSETFGST